MSTGRKQFERGGVALIVSIVVVVIVVAVLVFHFLSRREPEEIKNFQELVMRVDKLNTEMGERENKIADMVKKYNASHPDAVLDTTGLSTTGMTPEQAQLLASRVSQEKDISYKGLLQNVLDMNKEVETLNRQIEEIKNRIGPPHSVQKGESHRMVCLEFLTSKGMDEKTALEMIEKTALTPELLTGFEVWNYYDPEANVFGTFVTQGTAKMSPNALHRQTKRKIDQERKDLIDQRTAKEEEVKDLEARKAELLGQIENLAQEKDNMMKQAQELAAKNEGLNAQLNSCKYTINTFKKLDDQGIIKKPTLGKWTIDNPDAIPDPKVLDLRSDNRIAITASGLGLGKISKVLLFPRYYEENTDYKVIISDDKQSATVVLQKPERFKLTRLAIAVDG